MTRASDGGFSTLCLVGVQLVEMFFIQLLATGNSAHEDMGIKMNRAPEATQTIR